MYMLYQKNITLVYSTYFVVAELTGKKSLHFQKENKITKHIFVLYNVLNK